MRVVSLLLSATDTVIALNLQHLLVGRSHEVRAGPGGTVMRSRTPPLSAGSKQSYLWPSALSFPMASLSLQCDAPEAAALPASTSSRVGDSIPVAEIDAVMVRAVS